MDSEMENKNSTPSVPNCRPGKETIVVALGGNAILRPEKTAPFQNR